MCFSIEVTYTVLWNKTKSYLNALQEKQQPLLELENRLQIAQQQYLSLSETHEEYKHMMKMNEKEILEKSQQLQKQKVDIEELEKLLLAKNVEIGEGITQLNRRGQDVEKLAQKCEALEAELESGRNERLQLVEQLESLSSESKVAELQSKMAALQTGEISKW